MWYCTTMAMICLLLLNILGLGYSLETVTVSLQRSNTPSGLPKVYHEDLYGLERAADELVGNPTGYLKNVDNSYYYFKITTGTLPQSINVLFDTGSSFLWVPSFTLCATNRTICKYHNTYNNKKSLTYKQDGRTFKFDYVTGFVGGIVVQDNIDISGIVIEGQFFGEATNVFQDFLNSEIDGILGCSYSPQKSPNLTNIDTVIQNMFKRKLVKEAQFGVYLNNVDSNTQSEVTFGGVNPCRFIPPFIYTPLVRPTDWIIQLDRITVNNKEVTTGPVLSITDTGTTSINVAADIFEKLNQALKSKLDPNTGLYMINCNKVKRLPVITFVISNQSFPMTGEEYVIELNGPKGSVDCWIGIKPFQNLKGIFLGESFMRVYYTVFDYEHRQIGLARAR